MRVLGPKQSGDGIQKLGLARNPVERRVVPEEITELLGCVRMSHRVLQELVDDVWFDALAASAEPLGDERGEQARLDHIQLDLLRASPERLVLDRKSVV